MTTETESNASSRMKTVFRVIARVNVMVIECPDYPSAAKFCQNDYTGDDDLEIHKVWVVKQKTRS